RHRLRRLRASPDRGRRDARRAARVQPARARLGGVRAPLGLVVPARVPGGLRQRVRGGRRGDHRAGVPLEAAGVGAPVGARARARPERARHERARSRVARRHRRRHRARAPRRRSRRPDVERRLRRHPREAAAGAGVTGYRLVAAGDSAIVIEFDDRIDAAVNARAIALASALQEASVRGVRDVVPTYRSVAVYFDPLRTAYDQLVDRIGQELRHPSPDPSAARPPLRIPVCYGGDLGPDLPEVAAFAHVSEAEVVKRHAAATYRVFMLGFVAGFAYMGTVDASIAIP